MTLDDLTKSRVDETILTFLSKYLSKDKLMPSAIAGMRPVQGWLVTFLEIRMLPPYVSINVSKMKMLDQH